MNPRYKPRVHVFFLPFLKDLSFSLHEEMGASQPFRRLRNSDAKAVQQLDQACFSETWRLETFSLYAEKGHGFVYLDKDRKDSKNKIIGFILFDYRPSYDPADNKKYVFNITKLGVDPTYRRRGIGCTLLDQAQKMYKQTVYLQVRVSNTAAIELYWKQGFATVCTLPKFYASGEDGYLMKYTPK